MKSNFIFIYDNSKHSINSYAFSDIIKSKDIQSVEIKRKKINNIFLKILRRIHFSYRISRIINLPMKWIWYDTSMIKIDKNNHYNIIVTTDVLRNCDISIFEKLRKLKNVTLTLIIWDTIGVDTPVGRLTEKLYKNKIWDYIFSYDINDAQKYGFIYLEEHYYSMPKIDRSKKVDNDAYFIGGLKPGRTNEIIDLFKYLNKNSVNAKFDIVKNDGKTLEYSEKGFNVLSERQPYSYVLNETQGTNCIIEFLQTGQKGQSIRYFEAVCLNKKLLTNNKNVKNLSFYNEKYMKIFDKLEDIDIEWVKKKEEINYNYNNEFSPIHIIEKIEELEKK